jgi:hypothetical protein
VKDCFSFPPLCSLPSWTDLGLSKPFAVQVALAYFLTFSLDFFFTYRREENLPQVKEAYLYITPSQQFEPPPHRNDSIYY